MNDLNTERLTIRQFELTDAEFVLQLLNDESFLRFIGDKGVRTLEDACDYEQTLLSQGMVIASFERRHSSIRNLVEQAALRLGGEARIDEALLDE